MASAFSHALVGGAIGALAPAGVRSPALLATAAVVAVLPDADVAAFSLGIPYPHPLGHRGLTHGLPFATALGFASFALLRGAGRTQRVALWWAVLLALACASHGVLDALTDGGLGVGFLVPFSEARWFLPWRPIPVSPLSVHAFFSAQGAHILLCEALVIGLPTGLAAGVLWWTRRHHWLGSRR